MPDRDVFIISAVRTASCGLRDCPPEDLAAAVLKESMRQAGVAPERLDDMLWAGPADEGFSMLRVARRAGIPADMPMLEINWGRADGLQAVISGAQAILAGDADIVIAGGKGQAFRSRQKEPGAGNITFDSAGLEWIAEEMPAEISREALDDYAFQSCARANEALRAGRFDGQVAPLLLPDGSLSGAADDVAPALSRMELAGLAPLFDGQDRITAGNSARYSQGAAALLLASAQAVGKLNLMPMARIDTRVVVAGNQRLSGSARAARMALQKAGLSLDEIDVIEIEEDSAALALIWAREMNTDLGRINPNGGAIAHGNVPGAAGAIQITRLAHELARRRGGYGLVCMGGGRSTGTAVIIERV